MQLKITKVLNNNVVMSKDESNREIVVMGKGLAFQKRLEMRLNHRKWRKPLCWRILM